MHIDLKKEKKRESGKLCILGYFLFVKKGNPLFAIFTFFLFQIYMHLYMHYVIKYVCILEK